MCAPSEQMRVSRAHTRVRPYEVKENAAKAKGSQSAGSLLQYQTLRITNYALRTKLSYSLRERDNMINVIKMA